MFPYQVVNRESTRTNLRNNSNGCRDCATEGFACCLSGSTTDADDKRLLNNGYLCRRNSALTVRISHSERLSECSLDRSSNAERTSTRVRSSTTGRRDCAAEGFACCLSGSTTDADDKRLLNNSDLCGCNGTLSVCIGHREALSECSLDRLCNAERTSTRVRSSTTGRRDCAAEGFACCLSGSTTDADDKRLLNNSYLCRRNSALTVRISHSERLSECSLDRLCNAERTSTSVRSSTTGRRDDTVERLTSGNVRGRCSTTDADDKRLLNNSYLCRR